MTAGHEAGSPGHVNLVLEEDVIEGSLQVLLVLNVSLVVGPVHLHTHKVLGLMMPCLRPSVICLSIFTFSAGLSLYMCLSAGLDPGSVRVA